MTVGELGWVWNDTKTLIRYMLDSISCRHHRERQQCDGKRRAKELGNSHIGSRIRERKARTCPELERRKKLPRPHVNGQLMDETKWHVKQSEC